MYPVPARPDHWRLLPLAALLALSPLTGCVAPFSEMQSARVVGPGRAEITPSYSYVQASADGEREMVQEDFALQVGVGTGERSEVRMRYEAVRVSGETVHVLGAGPKLALAPGRAALYLPVGFAFGSDVESGDSWQFQPTTLFTFPLAERVELNTSAKGQIWLNADGFDPNLAFNVGLGVGDLERWAIRPEVGILVNPGEDGSFWHFSLGFSRTVGERR